MNSRVFLIIQLLAILLMAACAAPSTEIPATATQTASPVPTITPPTDTLTPVPVEISDIPGFEDWSVFNPPAVDISTKDNSLILTLKHRALWFMNQREVLAYKRMDGDFKITADIYTAKSSNPNQPPGGDGTVQLGGLMARSEQGGSENYVFIVVGDDGNGLSVETKSTTDSFSEYDGPVWDAANAELRICRSGQTFNLYKRHIASDEPWLLGASFERPDLPATLQAGVNIYSDSTPDLQVRYENIKIERVTAGADCETAG